MPVPINWPAIGFTILPNLGGIAGGFFTRKSIDGWLETLKRPEWRPPNWVFGPVWTTLYCTMGYASYLVFRDGGGLNGPARLPLMVYGCNLLLNWAWSPICFGAKRLDLAFYDLVFIDVTALATGLLFHKVNRTAGLLIVPYCLWLSIATALNFNLWQNNKGSPKITEVKDQ